MRGQVWPMRKRNRVEPPQQPSCSGLIIVFLILAAQFESWTLPGSVMTAVPFGILGALVFNWIRGLDNDVYSRSAFWCLSVLEQRMLC